MNYLNTNGQANEAGQANKAPTLIFGVAIPSRADGNDTLLVLNRIGGNLGTGAATLTNVFGIFYDDGSISNAASSSLAVASCDRPHAIDMRCRSS